MSLYDHIKRDSIKCPTCGATMDDFQSKSGFCHFLILTPKELVKDAERLGDIESEDRHVQYYDYCTECGTEVTFEFIPGHWERFHTTKEERREQGLGW